MLCTRAGFISFSILVTSIHKGLYNYAIIVVSAMYWKVVWSITNRISYRHPSMIEYILGSKAQLWLWTQHVGYQVNGSGWHSFPVRRGELQPSGQNGVEQLLLVAIRRWERWKPAKQDVQNHSRSPYINLKQNVKYCYWIPCCSTTMTFNLLFSVNTPVVCY